MKKMEGSKLVLRATKIVRYGLNQKLKYGEEEQMKMSGKTMDK